MASLPHLFPCLALLIFISIPLSSPQAIKPSKVVDQVCKQVSNYTFCVNAIYSDSRAITLAEDAAGLIEITLSLAYGAVTNTKSVMTTLLKDPAIQKDKQVTKALLHCRANYRQADKYLESAFDLKNSEVYFTLKDLVGKVVVDASDCENGFKKIGKQSPLTPGNKLIEDYSAICIVVASVLNS